MESKFSGKTDMSPLTKEEKEYFDSQENLFYNAEPGDRFLTRGGKEAMYIKNVNEMTGSRFEAPYCYIILDEYETRQCTFQGHCITDFVDDIHDIVSKIEKKVDEEELDKLVIEDCYYKDENKNIHLRTDLEIYDTYRMGYHKALKR